jgi:hypothetical protein
MVRTRSAASSMASGMPSNRWQIRTIVARLAASTANPGRATAARSANRRTVPPVSVTSRARRTSRPARVVSRRRPTQNLSPRPAGCPPGDAIRRVASLVSAFSLSGDPRGELGTLGESEFGQDALYMALGGALGDHQPRGDVLVGQSLRNQLGDLPLPAGQRRQRFVVGGRSSGDGPGAFAEGVGDGQVEGGAALEGDLERGVSQGLAGARQALPMRDGEGWGWSSPEIPKLRVMW